MVKKKPKPLTTEQRIDVLKSLGHGIVEIWKQPIPGYIFTSLGILALGKAKILPCHGVSALQGVHTYLALSHEIDEGGSLSFLEKAATGGTSLAVGLLWGNLVHKDGECLDELGEDPISQHTKCFDKCNVKIDYMSGDFIQGEDCYRKCMGWPAKGEDTIKLGDNGKGDPYPIDILDEDPFGVHKKPEGWP